MTNATQQDIDELNEITDEVLDETVNQIDEWGIQRHDFSFSAAARTQFARQAARYKEMNDARVEAGTLTWDGILLEEVFEALEEGDLERVRAELVQVAAVAVSAIRSIDMDQTELVEDALLPVTEGDESSD